MNTLLWQIPLLIATVIFSLLIFRSLMRNERAWWDLEHFDDYSRLRNSGLSFKEAWIELDYMWEAERAGRK